MFKVPDRYRVREGFMGSTEANENNGAFIATGEARPE